MKLKHVIKSQQFDREHLDEIFTLSKQMETYSHVDKVLHNKIMAILFYEPSTRTRLSFESAMIRMGGTIISTESAGHFSSAAKGETLEDSIRIVSTYCDVIVLRHYESGASEKASEFSRVPIINAGDGAGQHPTQALLDLYTIKKEKGKIDGIRIALVGDLYNGRTVRSLSYLLAKYKDVMLYFVAPEVVRMRDDIKEYLDRHGVSWQEETDFKKIAKSVDVIYQTRIQRERFGERIEDYEKAKGVYIIDKEMLSYIGKDTIIMHPLPRVDEITVEVDADPRAAYFRQAENGLYVRMALLKLVLE
mgnify:CR=1 FL=1